MEAGDTIKILHIFSGVGGGISTWIRKASMFSGDSIVNDAMAFHITNQSQFQDIIIQNGGKCFTLPRLRYGLIHFFRFISKTVKIEGYDVVHCHIDGYISLLFWIPVRLICKKPMIIHSHRTAIESIAGTYKEKPLYALNRFVNRLIAKNKVACGKKAAEFAFGNANDVKIIYNGINPITHDIYESKTKIGPINMLALGRLNIVKNHEFMLRIAQKLKADQCDFHLYIVGSGVLRDNLEKSIEEKGLSKVVSLEGYCDRPSIYLSKCDTFLLPSFSEGLPTVMIEAQEYGCKIIANETITTECDLQLGLVNYFGIEDTDIDKWAKQIIANGKKEPGVSKDDLNMKLINKGFINKAIYEDYYAYVKELAKGK